MATMRQYMAKDEGRNAVDDINIPLLGIKKNKVSNPSFEPSLFLIALEVIIILKNQQFSHVIIPVEVRLTKTAYDC